MAFSSPFVPPFGSKSMGKTAVEKPLYLKFSKISNCVLVKIGLFSFTIFDNSGICSNKF